MSKSLRNVKMEVMDLFGAISVEELIKNIKLQNLMQEISSSLDDDSIGMKAKNERRISWKGPR
ncbi:MAG: hypothetical protein K2P81_00440 [Bacteriovoracaceae bacterium]|nr:hypothetical protein [Bacteriovoracaceae bacterium]